MARQRAFSSMPFAVAVALRGGGEFLCPRRDGGFELAVGTISVDQPPCTAPLPLMPSSMVQK